jgi:hypothetical protein
MEKFVPSYRVAPRREAGDWPFLKILSLLCYTNKDLATLRKIFREGSPKKPPVCRFRFLLPGGKLTTGGPRTGGGCGPGGGRRGGGGPKGGCFFQLSDQKGVSSLAWRPDVLGEKSSKCIPIHFPVKKMLKFSRFLLQYIFHKYCIIPRPL